MLKAHGDTGAVFSAKFEQGVSIAVVLGFEYESFADIQTLQG